MKVRTSSALLGAVFCLIAAGGTYLVHLHSSFSAQLVRQGEHACAARQPCVLSLGQVFPGTWDHVIVFDMAASQDEIDSAVGHTVKRPELQRLIVFMKGGAVFRAVSEKQGVEHPSENEVMFADVPGVGNHITIAHDSLFVLARGGPGCDRCMTLSLLKPGQMVE